MFFPQKGANEPNNPPHPHPLLNPALVPKAVLIQYEILAGPDRKQARTTSSSSTSSSSTDATPSSSSSSSRNGGFQPLTSSGEKLVDEITGLLGGESLQGMGRKLMTDLKNKMGTAKSPPAPASSPRVQQQHQQPRNAQGSDPKAKYMEKVRVGTFTHTHTSVTYVFSLHYNSSCCHLRWGHTLNRLRSKNHVFLPSQLLRFLPPTLTLSYLAASSNCS